MEILIIGAEPPCVRCKAAFKFAQEAAADAGYHIEVRKIAAKSDEARKLGKIISGHDITELYKVNVDKQKIQSLAQEIDQSSKDNDIEKMQNKLADMDQVIMPSRNKATEQGFMMTPVVIINGKVICEGRVPTKGEIRQWLID